MKKHLIFILSCCSFLFVEAQRLITPQASPTQTIVQKFGPGEIELSYSRPGLKGRTLGDDFVTYGKLWRTGANGATTLTFSNDVIVGETKLPAGKYGLLSIPAEGEWIIIFTSDLDVNNPVKYQSENDLVRIHVPVQKLEASVETFTINFSHFTASGCNMDLMWEHSLITVPLKTNTDEVVMAQIEQIFEKDTKPYYAAAQYYYENDKDLTKAKEWIDIASADPRAEFMNHIWLLKARIYAKLGDKKGAKLAAEQTIKAAKHSKNADYERWAKEIIDSL